MKSFNQIYEEIYKQSNEDLERLRKEKNKRNLLFIVIAIVALLILINLLNSIIPIVFIIIMISMVFAIVNSKAKYTPIFKEKVIKPIIKGISENLEYFPNKNMPEVLYRQGKFEFYDDYHSEDLIEGLLDNKNEMHFAEVHTERESTDSDGNTTTYTVFYGMFGNVTMTKSIETVIRIRLDQGKLGRLFASKEKVEMDSSEFEKYFDIYAEDKIKAMQILTSDVMMIMIEFVKQSKLKYDLTIKNNQLYIRFYTGSMFEPKLFKRALDYDTLKEYYDIIEFILKVTSKINETIEKTEI